MGVRLSAAVAALFLVSLAAGSALAGDAGPTAPPSAGDAPAPQLGAEAPAPQLGAEAPAPELGAEAPAPQLGAEAPIPDGTLAEEQIAGDNSVAGQESADAGPAAGAPDEPVGPAAETGATSEGEGGAAKDASASQSPLDRVMAAFETEGARTALKALLGLLVFLLGWPLARLLAAGAYWLTSRVLRDPKLTALLGLELETTAAEPIPSGGPPPLHKTAAQIVSRVVFILAMAAGLVTGLHVSGLTAVSEPLDRFARAASYGLPLIGRALVILAISYVAARLLRTAVTVGLQRLSVDERLRNLSRRAGRAETAAEAAEPAAAKAAEPAAAGPEGARAASPDRGFSEQVGLVTYWLVLAFGLAATVESLEFVPLSQPLRDLLDRVITLLPALGAAALILAGGYLLGRLSRKVVTSLLEAAGFDRLVRRIDIGRTLERLHPSATIGLAAMLFVLVEAAIAALNQLGLTGVSAPLTAAVTQVGAAIPSAGLAILIMGIGHFLGRFVRTWTEGAITDLRVDTLLERFGILKPPADAGAPSSSSRVLGTAVYWLVMLLAAQQAFHAAGLTVWAGYVSGLLAFGFQKLAVAGLIVLVGFAVANLARKQILARQLGGAEAASWMAAVIRIFVLVFAITMAIQHVGVADRFVTLAFGFAFGGLCLALALAFGLGGREITSEMLRRRLGRKDD